MIEFKEDTVERRIFIVGCSRSGTTLLQTLIASHPEITTFPETGFFYNTVGENSIKKVLAKIGISTGREFSCLKNDIGKRLNIQIVQGKQSLLFKNNVELYLSILDKIAIERGKKNWVEKTPLHIMNVDLIQKYVPNFKIIHIVRDGREVVSSIYNRAQKYRNRFGNQDLDYAIELWNKAIRKTANNWKKENNYLVKYEDLVFDHVMEMNNIGTFLGMKFDEENFKNREEELTNSAHQRETWKNNVVEKIESRNNKFERLFDENKRKKILNKLINNTLYDF